MKGGRLRTSVFWTFAKVQIVGPDARQDDAEVVEAMARKLRKVVLKWSKAITKSALEDSTFYHQSIWVALVLYQKSLQTSLRQKIGVGQNKKDSIFSQNDPSARCHAEFFCQPRRTSAPPLSLDDLSLWPSLVWSCPSLTASAWLGELGKCFCQLQFDWNLVFYQLLSVFCSSFNNFFFAIDFCLCDELFFRISMDKISRLKPRGSTMVYGLKLLRSKALSLVVCLERRWAISKSKWPQWYDTLLVQLVWCESDGYVILFVFPKLQRMSKLLQEFAEEVQPREVLEGCQSRFSDSGFAASSIHFTTAWHLNFHTFSYIFHMPGAGIWVTNLSACGPMWPSKLLVPSASVCFSGRSVQICPDRCQRCSTPRPLRLVSRCSSRWQSADLYPWRGALRISEIGGFFLDWFCVSLCLIVFFVDLSAGFWQLLLGIQTCFTKVSCSILWQDFRVEAARINVRGQHGSVEVCKSLS